MQELKMCDTYVNATDQMNFSQFICSSSFPPLYLSTPDKHILITYLPLILVTNHYSPHNSRS